MSNERPVLVPQSRIASLIYQFRLDFLQGLLKSTSYDYANRSHAPNDLVGDSYLTNFEAYAWDILFNNHLTDYQRLAQWLDLCDFEIFTTGPYLSGDISKIVFKGDIGLTHYSERVMNALANMGDVTPNSYIRTEVMQVTPGQDAITKIPVVYWFVDRATADLFLAGIAGTGTMLPAPTMPPGRATSGEHAPNLVCWRICDSQTPGGLLLKTGNKLEVWSSWYLVLGLDLYSAVDGIAAMSSKTFAEIARQRDELSGVLSSDLQVCKGIAAEFGLTL